MRDNTNTKDLRDDQVAAIRDELNVLLKKREITAALVSREANVSSATLSLFLKDQYSGRNDRIAARLRTWIDTWKRRVESQDQIQKGPGYIHTPTAEKILSALDYAHMAGDMALIYGGAGIGKTETLKEYVRNNAGICFATMTSANKTVATALTEIAKCVGVPPKRNNSMLFDAICVAIKDQRGLLIIDEAQHLGAQALDIIRAIHDKTGCGIVLVGNEQVYSRISGGGTRAEYLDRLYSRVGMRLELGRSTEGDAHALAEAWKVSDVDAVKLLVAIAKKPGGLRGITKTMRLATLMARKDSIHARHIRKAWNKLVPEAKGAAA